MTTAAQLAYASLCEGITFAVLDTETCPEPPGADRVISIAVVTWRDGERRSLWSRQFNPGVPISNSHIHGLSEIDVVGKDMFPGAIGELNELLDGAVLVCHNAAFDVGVLKAEYERAGRAFPVLPVLDTQGLPKALGYEMPTKGTGLATYCRHFEVTNTAPHDAAGDAEATGRVLKKLLTFAARGGVTDFAELHAKTNARTTENYKPATKPVRPQAQDRADEVSDAHLATHAILLPVAPDINDLRTWVHAAVECARLRCPLLTAKARAALVHARSLHPLLTRELEKRSDSFTPGQGATFMGAINELAAAGIYWSGNKAPFATWWRKKSTHVKRLARCSASVQCPACSAGDPCPIDVAHLPIIEAYVFDGDALPERRRLAIFREGDDKTVFARWQRMNLTDILGYALYLVADAWEADGKHVESWEVIQAARRIGVVEPRLLLKYVSRLALQGAHEQVDAEMAAISERTTDLAWAELDIWYRRTQARRAKGPSVAAVRNRSVRVARPEGRLRPKRYAS